MSAVQDRPYQSECVDRTFDLFQRGVKSALAVLPTGTGKTVIAGRAARKIKDEFSGRTLFLAERQELINQAADKLSRFDLECAIEMADQNARSNDGLFGKSDVVVGTVQTLQKNRLAGWNPREFKLVIVDEAHHARAQTYRNTLGHFGSAWLMGITATPDRGDGANLGAVFEELSYEYKLRAAIRDGYLVPIQTARLHTTVDLNEIRTTGGDFNQADLERKIAPHIEELADAIRAEIGDRQTVVFCPDVGSAEAMASALAQMGDLRGAEAVSGKLPRPKRQDILRRYEDGKFQVIVCCDLLTEGWDCPRVSAVVVCRPTKKRNRYAQMIGRGTRPHPDSGKADCLVIDFAWETTNAHELCTPVDLFDDSNLDDEVLEVAEKLLKEGKETDPEKAIDEAEQIVANTFKIKLSGRKADYSKVIFDPVGVGHIVGVTIKAGWDFNPSNPASPKQLDYLRKLGVERPDGLSRQGAGKMIDRLSARRDQGLATVKQVTFLQTLGVDAGQSREMTFDQASRTISQLIAGGGRKAG